MDSHIREPDRGEQAGDAPQTIGQILAELLALYQIRFPQAQISIVETPAATV